ncbi:hypothetical protein BDV41DRAFT_530434 [Aspergillus transmontanensis]|uniref:Uncharacterized protein n=1 Tax=Aspergillus transmontanensis TaxID=1034304 RepID=A0A5N6W420_9EURO|nr:hypothetical protein BDV41DRAFT_530434 [Aspergillus transmontanensis]
MSCRLVTIGFNALGHPIRNVLKRNMAGHIVPIKENSANGSVDLRSNPLRMIFYLEIDV